MKRELKALFFLLSPTNRSREKFIELTLIDDREKKQRSEAEYKKNLKYRDKREEKRRVRLRMSLEHRRRELYQSSLFIIIVLPFVVWVGTQITTVSVNSNWLAQISTVVLVILSRKFEIKNSEMVFNRDDLLERVLQLSRNIFFWTSVCITILLLLIPSK